MEHGMKPAGPSGHPRCLAAALATCALLLSTATAGAGGDPQYWLVPWVTDGQPQCAAPPAGYTVNGNPDGYHAREGPGPYTQQPGFLSGCFVKVRTERHWHRHEAGLGLGFLFWWGYSLNVVWEIDGGADDFERYTRSQSKSQGKLWQVVKFHGSVYRTGDTVIDSKVFPKDDGIAEPTEIFQVRLNPGLAVTLVTTTLTPTPAGARRLSSTCTTTTRRWCRWNRRAPTRARRCGSRRSCRIRRRCRWW